MTTPRHQSRAIVVVAVLAVVLCAGGVVASQWIKSPAQVATETAPPKMTRLTTPVQSQVIRRTLVLRGTVRASQTFSAMGAGPSAIVTAIPLQPGAKVDPGAVILEIAGRPLVGLQGDVPMYRDVGPTDEGKDVAQLQAALRSLGFATTPDADGRFGAGTKRAVAGWYRGIGYEARTTADADALTRARDAVTQLARKLADLELQANNAASAVSGSPATAQGDAAARTQAAAGSAASISLQLHYTREDLAAAKRQLFDAETRSGPMVPQSEVLFLPPGPAQVVSVGAQVGQPAKDPIVTVSIGDPVVTARLPPGQEALVRPGMAVTVSNGSAYHGNGTVSSIGDLNTPSDNTKTAPYIPVTVVTAEPAQAVLIGRDVQVTITAAESAGAVLAVPVSALNAGTDGDTYVICVQPDGTTARVPVTVGVMGDGLVQITPRQRTLAPGDNVVTGLSSQAPSGPPPAQVKESG